MLKKIAQKYLTPVNIALIILFIIFFFYLRLNLFTAPFERDEGNYAYSSWLLRRGLMPYEYSFPNKPPMIFYTYALGQILFGDNVLAPRIMAVVFSLLTILFIWLIAKQVFGRASAWISAFLLSVMLILPGGYGNEFLADIYYAANTEIFMILPLVILVFIYQRYSNSDKIIPWFSAGVLSSVALNYKPICWAIIGYVFLFWILKSWQSQRNTLQLIKRILLSVSGFLLMTFLIYLPFILSDGGQAVSEQLIKYTGCYISSSDWVISLPRLFLRLGILWKYYWLIFLLVIYLSLKKAKNLIFFLGLLLVAYFSIAPSIIGHFYIQIMPFLALVSAAAINELVQEKIFADFKIKLGLIAVVFITILYPLRQMFNKTPPQIGLWVYGPYDQFYEAETVGRKISQLTSQEDFIFVEGDDGEITYFAQRRSSVRMEFTGSLTSKCAMLKKYQADYLKDFTTNTPEVISLCLSGSCRYIWSDAQAKPFMENLIKLINRDYYAVGGWIPQGQGYWLEPIQPEDIQSARTVLFKRR